MTLGFLSGSRNFCKLLWVSCEVLFLHGYAWVHWVARSCTTTAYRWLFRDSQLSLRTLWSAVIKSPKFTARGTASPFLSCQSPFFSIATALLSSFGGNPERALLRSQGGPLSGLPFVACPSSPHQRFVSHLFRVLLLRGLHLPSCRCGHRTSCPTSGVLGRRGFALESAAARVCREASARVRTNVFVRDLDLLPQGVPDQRRLEVVAEGLPLFHGAQLAIDTTLVSPLRADGAPHIQCADVDGAALRQARRQKERTYPELSGAHGRVAGLLRRRPFCGCWCAPTPVHCQRSSECELVKHGFSGGALCWRVPQLGHTLLPCLSSMAVLGYERAINILLFDIQIRMSSSEYISAFQWNREWFFSRRVKFDSGFNVMAVHEASRHGHEIVYRLTGIRKWVLRLWKRPFWFSKKVNITLSLNWSRPCQGGCSQFLISSRCFDSFICDWKNKLPLLGKYHLFRIESFRVDFRCVHRFQLLKVCDQYVTFPNSPRVQSVSEEQSR